MENKGFTLIELLGVIVILALLMIITFPSVINLIKSSSNEKDDLVMDLIYNATEMFIKDNRNSYPSVDGNSYCITLTDLIEHGDLKGPINLNNEDVTNKKSVQVTYSDKFSYELKDSNSCIENKTIGKAVTAEIKTLVGNIPKGNFDLGDEYIINVDGVHQYHFYVFSTEGDKVNLILSNNICEDGSLATKDNVCKVAWILNDDYIKAGGTIDKNDGGRCQSEGYCSKNDLGPITAMNYLYNATKNWNNISNIEMNYIDSKDTESYGYGGIITNGTTTKIISKDGKETASYKNLKARMLNISEIRDLECTSNAGSCPIWMINGLAETKYYSENVKENIENIFGYWSLSSLATNSSNVRYIDYNGYRNDNNCNRNNSNGIRPVIELYKSDLS